MNGADERDLLARLAAELETAPPIDLQLPAASALAVTACLYLALRHPDIPAGPAAHAREVIAAIAERVGPAMREAINTDFEDEVVVYTVPSADWLADRLLVERGAVERLVDDVRAPRATPPPGFADGFAVDWGRVAGRDSDIAIYTAPPIGPSLSERLFVDVDERIPPDKFVVMSGDPAHPKRGGDAVVVTLPSTPALPDGLEEGRRPLGVVRPAGLVWSGIRVDEMERLYTICGPETSPAKLEDGEIYGEPSSGRVWVWSLADFRRLADLSRFLHELRRRGLRTPLTESERELGERWQAAIRAANTGAPALDVVRALPAGGGSS